MIRPALTEQSETILAEVVCAHCSLPVPKGLVNADSDSFCCIACKAAYSVIHGAGLSSFYDLLHRAESPAMQAKGTGARYEELDDPAFHASHVRQIHADKLDVELRLEGLRCYACVWLLESLPRIHDGVLSVHVDLGRSLVRVRWAPDEVELSAIAGLIDSLGYRVYPATGVQERNIRRREERAMLVRIAIAGVCAGNIMLIAFALYGEMLSGMAPSTKEFFRWVSAGLGLVCVFGPGNVFLKGAWSALRMKHIHLDLPIALALLVGSVSGMVNVIASQGHIYFESLSGVVFLLLIGRFLQQRTQRKAFDAVEMLLTLSPTYAYRVVSERTERVPIEAIELGDRVEVRGGCVFPVDGVVVEGDSFIDESLMSGESVHVRATAGKTVSAGTTNMTSTVRVRATARGEQTQAARLSQLVEESMYSRPSIVLMADRIAGAFVAIIIVLACITFGVWLILRPAVAIDNAVALLIVTCPCALGLATPLTVRVAIGRAAKRGVLIRGGHTLEMLEKPGVMLFDKTGTLTHGRMRVTQWVGDDETLQLARAVEAHALHPIARAFSTYDTTELLPATKVQLEHGGGVSGVVEGRHVIVGSISFLQERGCDVPLPIIQQMHSFADDGDTPVCVAVDGQAVALAGIGDQIREEAARLVRTLVNRGWRVELLSGDHQKVVTRVGDVLGIPAQHCHGLQTPEDKREYVRMLGQQGTVVMVGDGVNDAAAIATASVSIAMQGGAEATRQVADVSLTTDCLKDILKILDGSIWTMRTIRTSLAVSASYNIIAALLAMGGLINPMIAAGMMPMSSLTVIGLAMRNRAFREPKENVQ